VGRSDRLAIANVAAHDRRMVEYGHGVGTATGVAGGGHGGGGSMDAGAAFGQFITDTVNNISALPPTTIFLGIVAIVVGFIILKRAF
jgi:hypothetical protein